MIGGRAHFAQLDNAFGSPPPAASATSPVRDEEVRVTAGPVELAGHLTIPEHPTGIVVFAHGSGSSRHSPRNRFVAAVLNGAGLATLLFDLLTPQEERDRANVFDIELLARRLLDVTGWLADQPDTAAPPVGYFGASTGAGAALVAAADPKGDGGGGGLPRRAARSRRRRAEQGRRPDAADRRWTREVVLALNRRARAAMPGARELAVVARATHLFEEPGTLERVAELARDWFVDHLSPPDR